MPYQVKQILEGKGEPVCIEKDEPVSKALSIMIEHDYSQLPVFTKENPDYAEWMVTHEGILRGIRNFKAKIDDLCVRDVMVKAPLSSMDDDLFDILDRLKETNAILVMHSAYPVIVGIVTSYDTMEYFRNRTEDLMRVEDIEIMVKDFILSAYLNEDGEVDQLKLDSAIGRVSNSSKLTGNEEGKAKDFDRLSLGEYISLLLLKDTWSFFDGVFKISREALNQLLNGVRETRNALAHFRGNIYPEHRDQLRFAAEWLSRRQDEIQALLQNRGSTDILTVEPIGSGESFAIPSVVQESPGAFGSASEPSSADYAITESSTYGGRYSVLADWLQSQPGKIDQVVLTFNQIEEIIQSDLPPSARNHRAWWANDSVGHSHSQLWLDAGWRTTYINLTEGRITFSRIREREKAYIDFFSKLLDELRKRANFPVKDVSPDGASWIVIQTVPSGGPGYGIFAFSFKRDRTLRVELYIDLGDQRQNKAVFDRLVEKNDEFTNMLGVISWERLENRRASRIAMYHPGWITEVEGHEELRKWAAETMVKFYNVLSEPAEKAIIQVRQND